MTVPGCDRRRVDAAIGQAIGARKSAGQPTVLVTVHSFTPVYRGVSRDVQIGILHDADSRLADQMLQLVDGRSGYQIRRNEPYGPADGVTHSLRLHALPFGLLNVMIEIRNDLIADAAGQQRAADYLTGSIQEALGRLSP